MSTARSTDSESKSVLLFSQLNKTFFGYFDSGKDFWIMEIHNFRGDLTDVLKKSLIRMRWDSHTHLKARACLDTSDPDKSDFR